MLEKNHLQTTIAAWCQRLSADMQRVENSVGPGTPDMNICFMGGREVWVETKIESRDGVMQIRPEQRAWHVRRRQRGARCFFVSRFMEEFRFYIMSTTEPCIPLHKATIMQREKDAHVLFQHILCDKTL